MTVEVIAFLVLTLLLYLITGLLTLEVWGHLLDGVEKKSTKVCLRLLLLLLWPVLFVVFFIFLVAYGIFWFPSKVYKDLIKD